MSVRISVESLSGCAWSGCPSQRGIRNVVKGKLAGGLFGTVRFSEKGTLDFSGPAVGAPKTKGL
ncbi:water stress/hypersensitive response domain-containing protein, partial [Pseudomonas aeruginosa]|nr:water stress/hypersensitive response domain-containing protein [Pseudomonas aeruginosa]